MNRYTNHPLARGFIGNANSPHTRGFMLIMCLQFLIVLALLSLAMLRSFGLQERIAGNVRDKERALAAAQSALQYGETWLRGNSAVGAGAPCNGASPAAGAFSPGTAVDATAPGAMVVCSNALANPAALPWAWGAEYQPTADMSVQRGGGVTDKGDIHYQAKPGLYIQYLGMAADGISLLYRITAYGYGGNGATAAVVQSTYALQMQQSGGIHFNSSLDGL